MRIAFYTSCTEESLIFSMIYIDRLSAMDRRYMVTSYNVHRLVLTSILVAAKFNDDIHFKNSHYSNVGGISIKEMNSLERIFLHRLKFDLHVGKKLFKCYRKCFDKAISAYGSVKMRTRVQQAKVVIPVPTSSYNLVAGNLWTIVTNTQNLEYGKHFSSARHYPPGRRNVYLSNPWKPNINYREVRSSQQFYIPANYYGPDSCNPQGALIPVLST